MKQTKLLFFGDSITDMARDREEIEKASKYGTGYVFCISGELMFKEPGKYIVVNRGNGGNKITDLYDRYISDVINEKPDVVTILIGVNDVWHGINHPGQGTPIDVFEELYLKMVEDIKSRIKDVTIILMEPFYLLGLATEEKFEEFEKIREYALVVKRIAEQTNSKFICLQDQFEIHAKNAEVQFLYDGIHTNPAGAYLIAKEWVANYYKIKSN